jgi:aspartyl-tRNA(Asn)/glutamyl-tRNA(Gln) amidotransferase subunit B
VKAANWILTEVLRNTKVHGLEASIPVSPSQVAELLALVEQGDISGKQAKEVYAALEGSDERPAKIVEKRGMKVVSDAGELKAICERLIASSPKQVEQYRAGKTNVLGFFVGQVMKETKGSANPKLVNQLLTELLGE